METAPGSLIETFLAGPERITTAVAGCSSTALRASDAGGWAIHDVLVHLADAEAVRATRIRLILAEDRPALFNFDEEAWRGRLNYLERDPWLALEAYRLTVRSTVDLLAAAPAVAWDGVGVHVQDGDLSVRTLIERGIRHASDHAVQIHGLRA